MRPATQVAPAGSPGLGIDVVVDGEFVAAHLHDLGTALAADKPQLERLARELMSRLVVRDDASREALAGLHDLLHALLEHLEVLRGERALDREVVVETVLDGWPDAELRLRKGVLNGLGQHMRGRVPQHSQAFRRIDRYGLDDITVAQRGRQVAQFAIDSGYDNGAIAADDIERGGAGRYRPGLGAVC